VTVGDQANSDISSVTFSYAAPTISRIQGCALDSVRSTTDCSVSGGDTIMLTGENLGSESTAVAVVEIAGQLCTNVVYLDPHQQLNCTVPANAAGGFDVDVVSLSPLRFRQQFRICLTQVPRLCLAHWICAKRTELMLLEVLWDQFLLIPPLLRTTIVSSSEPAIYTTR
jgi:hypothetical protein